MRHRTPLCLHAIHKQTVEQYLELYRRLFGIRFTVARITNPYGPGQPAGRTAYGVINRLIHLALADRALTIYGDGAQLRDYVHVDDVVQALLTMAAVDRRRTAAPTTSAAAPARAWSISRTIVIAIAGARPRRARARGRRSREQIETGDFVADMSRIERELGWPPRDRLARRARTDRGVLSCFAAASG